MKKTILISLLPLMLLSSCSLPMKAEIKAEDNPVVDENYIGADFTSGVYTYELEKKFRSSPNTIEAWVRMGPLSKDEPGGIIFSNYEYYNYNPVRLEVNTNRQITLQWNRGQANLTFATYAIPVEKWTHVAVVRNPSSSSFRLYINGALQEEQNKSTTDAISDFRFIVGGDWSNWHDHKKAFKGEIASVAAYHSSLTSSEIARDYRKEDEITGTTREDLLFSADFSFNCQGATDKSRYENNATIRSNDYFYRDDLYAPQDYGLFIIPDPQIMTHWLQANLATISDYIISKKDDYNIEMAICVGDNADGSLQWDFELPAIKNVFNNLTEAGVRWVTTPGNHDYDDNCSKSRALTNYNRYFTAEEISSFSWFGGLYEEGQTQNAYYTFETTGVKYLVISMEFGSTPEVLSWADGVLSEPRFQDHRVIVYTHAYIGGDGERLAGGKPARATSCGFANYNNIVDADDMWNQVIRKHKNVFMVFNGHVPYDDIVVRTDVGDYGNTITCMLIDAQGILYGGAASLVALLNFDELNQQVYVNYVCTTSGELYNIQNQFTYSFKGHTDILSSVYYEPNGELKAEYKGGQAND